MSEQKKVTASEEVRLWIRKNGIPRFNVDLYQAFPHVKKDTLLKIKMRYVESLNKKTEIKRKKSSKKKEVENTENITNTDSQLLPEDLLNDIKKVKSVMNQFGEGVRLKEVTEFMKDMNALKPSKEEEIKISLKKLDLDELCELINPDYKINVTRKCLFDENEIRALYSESDL